MIDSPVEVIMKNMSEENIGLGTYQANCRGCSGALIDTPGDFGSSIISGSGGLGEPSTLNDIARCFAIRAVIASRLGMFLYPIFLFG
jgi:hypothetical protein